MQVFGKFKEVHELEYLTKCYLYINKDEEETLNCDELNSLLKKKNKNVAGTIFLYNPYTAPMGYDLDKKLQDQDFSFDDKFHEIQIEDAIRLIGKHLKHKYKGMLVEIKFLFNYIKKDILPTSALEVFDMDLEKLHTNQLTVFGKKDNYHDYKNISYNGNFIFFAWGHKYDKHHPNIATYAVNIAQWAKKLNKDIGFIYDGVQDVDQSFEYTRFIHPVVFGKLKNILPNALEELFKKDKIEPFSIKNM